MKVCSLLLALLLLLPSAARGGEAEDETPADLPSTTWPNDGRVACPSLQACCVEGEEHCTHPAAARALLAGVSVGHFGVGLAMFAAGDGLDKGDPLGGLVGIGIIGTAGSLLGLVAGLLAPRGETTVADRPSRPAFRVSLTPGGSSTIGEQSPYGLSVRVDPTFVLGPEVRLQPHIGLSTELGQSTWLDPRPQLAESGSSTFPVALTSHRTRISLGLELALALPYPHKLPRPLYTGPVELRWKPWFELRRRVLQPGTDARQLVGHTALYAAFGMRWHVSPRQRSLEPRLGQGAFGSLYAEARWQLDVPFTPLARKATSVTGRLNIGYVHSNLDGRGIDLGPIVGFFGPVELSFDLRIRKVGAPVALQVTAGYRIAAGGGPVLELGLVTPSIGGARRAALQAQ